jgi:hypothetical protein
MRIARSIFYNHPVAAHDDTAIVEAIAAVCDEFEFYGWRRVRAGLRHRGMIVNHKKIRRLMRRGATSNGGRSRCKGHRRGERRSRMPAPGHRSPSDGNGRRPPCPSYWTFWIAWTRSGEGDHHVAPFSRACDRAMVNRSGLASYPRKH